MKASIVQWLEYLPSKQVARVRFPVDALFINPAALAQLGERQTEDLKVPGSIPGGGTHFGF